ncbi:hypothetical protein PUN28_013218 [Cardiocondyla obscurior]|uniref:Ribosomal protein S14 n=1 Tax=Cardiocondyla obscurior TaxID=286306 RepID=A0AAW2FAU1_9HYME
MQLRFTNTRVSSNKIIRNSVVSLQHRDRARFTPARELKITSTKQSAEIAKSCRGLPWARSNVESYRYLSRRNPPSSQCLPVKWVNKSFGVIHLSRSAAAKGIVATRKIQGSRSTDRTAAREGTKKKKKKKKKEDSCCRAYESLYQITECFRQKTFAYTAASNNQTIGSIPRGIYR